MERVGATARWLKTKFFEAQDLWLGERLLRNVRKGWAAPKTECLAEDSRCRRGRFPLRLLDQPLEQEQVELARFHSDQVAGLARHDGLVRGKRPTQS